MLDDEVGGRSQESGISGPKLWVGSGGLAVWIELSLISVSDQLLGILAISNFMVSTQQDTSDEIPKAEFCAWVGMRRKHKGVTEQTAHFGAHGVLLFCLLGLHIFAVFLLVARQSARVISLYGVFGVVLLFSVYSISESLDLRSRNHKTA